MKHGCAGGEVEQHALRRLHIGGLIGAAEDRGAHGRLDESRTTHLATEIAVPTRTCLVTVSRAVLLSAIHRRRCAVRQGCWSQRCYQLLMLPAEKLPSLSRRVRA